MLVQSISYSLLSLLMDVVIDTKPCFVRLPPKGLIWALFLHVCLYNLVVWYFLLHYLWVFFFFPLSEHAYDFSFKW